MIQLKDVLLRKKGKIEFKDRNNSIILLKTNKLKENGDNVIKQ